MSVTDRIRKFNHLDAGEIGAEADRIEAEVASRCVEVPLGADGLAIVPGDVVYGADGRGWKVIGIGRGCWKVIVVPDGAMQTRGEFKRLKPQWCRHREPLPRVAARVRAIAAKGTGITIADIASLEAIADDLAGRGGAQ